MATEGNTPGNGSTSPFGDGNGATQAAGAAKGNVDFTTNPNGDGSPPARQDQMFQNRAQKGRADGWNPDTVPAGGRLPFNDPKGRAGATLQTVGSGKKPYKLGGEGTGGAGRGDAPMTISGGGTPAEAGSTPEETAE